MKPTITFLLIFGFIFSNQQVFAQGKFFIYGKVLEDSKKLGDVNITVKKFGKVVQTITTPGSGKFEFELDFNGNYNLAFEKKDYVTKNVQFSTFVPEGKTEDDFEDFPFEVTMFQQPEGATMTFNQPVAKVSYREEANAFGYDLNYSKSIEKEIQEFEKAVEKKKEEIAQKKQETAQTLKPPPPTPSNTTTNTQTRDIDIEAEKRKAQEEARKKAEEEAARKRAQQLAIEEAKRKAQEEAEKQKQEEEKQKALQSQALAKQQEEAKKKLEEEAARKEAEKMALMDEASRKAREEELRKEKEAALKSEAEAQALTEAQEKAKNELLKRQQEAAAQKEVEKQRVEQAKQEAQEQQKSQRIVNVSGESQVVDGFYERKIYKEKEIIPYDFISEADVFWEKRIWRIIDVREKMNLFFAYPKKPLIHIILSGAEGGEIQAYNAIDDHFTQLMTPSDVQSIGRGADTITVTDPITLEEKTEVVQKELDLSLIKKFRVKEDWFFDKETSTLQVRIIGIAPIMDKYDDNGNYLGELPMFWIYYPELRNYLVHFEAFNDYSNAKRLTWSDVFEMRFFSSYIIKESNPLDRRIQDYKAGVDAALLEADKIKNNIFQFEHDLWTY